MKKSWRLLMVSCVVLTLFLAVCGTEVLADDSVESGGSMKLDAALENTGSSGDTNEEEFADDGDIAYVNADDAQILHVHAELISYLKEKDYAAAENYVHHLLEEQEKEAAGDIEDYITTAEITEDNIESLSGVYVLVEREGDPGFDQTFLDATKLPELPGIKIMVIENDASDITAHFYYYNEGKQVVYTGLQDDITKISTPYVSIIEIRGNTIVLDGAEWKLEGDRIIKESQDSREVYEKNDDIDLTEASFEVYPVGN